MSASHNQLRSEGGPRPDDSLFSDVEWETSPFGQLIEQVRETLPPPDSFDDSSLARYLELTIREGLRRIHRSRDALGEVRRDANTDPWEGLRAHAAPYVWWMGHAEGPGSLHDLAHTARVPAIEVVGILGASALAETARATGAGAPSALRTIAVGLGIAFALSRRQSAVAGEWLADSTNPPNQHDAQPMEGWTSRGRLRWAVRKVLLDRLVELEYDDSPTVGDAAEFAGILYHATCRCLDETERLDIIRELEALACERQVRSISLYVLVSGYFSDWVIRSATLALAQVADDDEERPLGAVDFLAERAKYYLARANPEDGARAAAILSGLLLLGDRRVIEHLGACWRWLSPPERRALSELPSEWAFAPVVDWLLDWL